MKGRESGMPSEEYWGTFFESDTAVTRLLGNDVLQGDIVEFGCGYGTFTIPAARRISGVTTALDIDTEMIATVRRKAEAAGLANVTTLERDFMAHGAGLTARSQSHAMIYNLLHVDDPLGLLKEAYRVLVFGGRLSIMHWRSDIPTPRGPSLDIRPTPEQCLAWIERVGFKDIDAVSLRDCCPFHFGLVASRQDSARSAPRPHQPRAQNSCETA